MMGLFEHYLLLVFTTVICVDYATTCSCLGQHPQTMFCESSFVMLARLRGKGELSYRKEALKTFGREVMFPNMVFDPYPVDMKYNVQIKELFMGNQFLNENSTVAEIHTHPDAGLCGVSLGMRTKYLLAGHLNFNGQLKLHSCGWNTAWRWVSKMQKKALRSTYKLNCDCKVHAIGYGFKISDDPGNTNSCKWDVSRREGTCYQQHSACIHDKNSSTGGCKWQRNHRLKKCLKEFREP